MQITLLGQTDKRAVLYTMLKMCENIGDCCYITNDRKAQRLMEEGPDESGTYRNIHIYVLDTTPDDVWGDIGYAPSDYEFTFMDNLYNEQTDLVVYVKGAGDEDIDLDVIDVFEPDEYITIKMGSPAKPPKGQTKRDKKDKKAAAKENKNAPKHKVYTIPYTAQMPENIEHCEFYKELIPITPVATKVCAEILSTKCGISAGILGKVAKTRK